MSRWRNPLILPIVLLALSFSGCEPEKPWPYTVELDGARVNVLVAISEPERNRGLMYRETLESDWGMVFVFESEQPLDFWMKDTKVPLSIAFLDKDLVVRDIQDMAPMTEDEHHSKVPAMYALEVNQGWFAKHDVKVGTKAKFSPELEKYIRENRAAK